MSLRMAWLALLLASCAAAQVASIDLRPYGFKPTRNAAYRPDFHTSEVAYLTDGSLVVGFRRGAEVMGNASAANRNMMPVRLLRFDAQSGKLLARADRTVERDTAVTFLTAAPDGDLLLRGTRTFVLLNASLREIVALGLPPHAQRVDLAAGGASFAVGVRAGENEHFGVVALPRFEIARNFTIAAGAPVAILSDGYASIRTGEQGDLELVIVRGDQRRAAKLPANDFDCRPSFGALPENHVVIAACHHFWVYDEEAKRVLDGDMGSEDDLVGIAVSAASGRFVLITIEGFSGGPMDQQRIYGEAFRALVYDLDTRAKVRTVKLKPMPKLGGAFALSPDGKTLAVLKDGAVEQVVLDGEKK